MQNITIGQRIRNKRTNDSGKVKGFKTVWTGRHDVKKVVADVDGIEKVWAFSSCEIIEEVAPRALVKLRDLFNAIKENSDRFKDELAIDYNNDSAITAIVGDMSVNIDSLTEHTSSATAFRNLSCMGMLRVITFIELASCAGTIPTYKLGLSDFEACNRFTSALFKIYLDKKAG